MGYGNPTGFLVSAVTRWRASLRDRDRQVLESAQRERRPAFRLSGELDRGEPAHERPDGGGAFESGQGGAETEVVPTAERDVAVGVLAAEVELVGLRERVGVA